MKIRQEKVRKFLSTKIHELNDVVADLDTLVTENGFRIFFELAFLVLQELSQILRSTKKCTI
jgi:VanZ family protein